MPSRWEQIVVDAVDPARLARWWAETLGYVVVNEEPDLPAHYAAEVIGGPGAFVMACADYVDFAEAIRRKLVRELRGALTA